MNNEFLAKLAALLIEYQVSISFDMSDCSDTHGISGEAIALYDAKGEQIIRVSGYSMSAGDIIDEM